MQLNSLGMDAYNPWLDRRASSLQPLLWSETTDADLWRHGRRVNPNYLFDPTALQARSRMLGHRVERHCTGRHVSVMVVCPSCHYSRETTIDAWDVDPNHIQSAMCFMCGAFFAMRTHEEQHDLPLDWTHSEEAEMVQVLRVKMYRRAGTTHIHVGPRWNCNDGWRVCVDRWTTGARLWTGPISDSRLGAIYAALDQLGLGRAA